MGKYNPKKLEGEKPIEGQLAVQLAIANELAEANRLKRLEIKMQHEGYLEECIEDLHEDQA